MLRIKLAHFGKKNQPSYRIVINEDREKRDGRYVDNLGVYAPTQTPKILTIDVKKFEEWLKKGAEPTDTVAKLFERFKSGNPFPAKKKKPNKKQIAKNKADEEAKAAAVEAPVEEAPAAAAPTEEVTTEEVTTEETKAE
jgi:small subunit ribosomal protein S16